MPLFKPLFRGSSEFQPFDLLIQLTASAEGGGDVGFYQLGCARDAVLFSIEQLVAGAAGLAERDEGRADGVVF